MEVLILSICLVSLVWLVGSTFILLGRIGARGAGLPNDNPVQAVKRIVTGSGIYSVKTKHTPKANDDLRQYLIERDENPRR